MGWALPNGFCCDSHLSGNKQANKYTGKVVISQSEARARQRNGDGEGLVQKELSGKASLRWWPWPWHNLNERDLQLQGNHAFQFSLSYPLTSPQTKSHSSPLSTNICLLPMASKIYVNHTLFKQTHSPELIWYAHLTIIHFMDLLKGKKMCVI